MINAQEANKKELVDIDYTKCVRYARVVKVYDADNITEQSKYGKVDLVWLDSGAEINGSVSFITPNFSSNYGCGIIAFPLVGDIAACYTLPDAPPVILGFLPRRIYKSIHADKSNIGDTAYVRKLRAGEILIKSKAQTELFLSNDGNVTVSVRNGNNTTPVVNPDPQHTTVGIFDKPSCEEVNTTVELELGPTDRMVGPGTQVASICGGSYERIECVINSTKGGFTYPLGSFTNCDVCDVESVELFKNKTRVRSLDRNSVSLVNTYTYVSGIDNQYDAGQYACSVDSNTVLPSIVLPKTIARLLDGTTKIKAILLIRRNAFSVRANNFGDIFLNCRNFVARTARNTATFGLYETDSRAVLNAAKVDIGDKLNGSIRTNKAGVSISNGLSEEPSYDNKSEAEKKEAKVLRAVSTHEQFEAGKHYFYILEELPLFCYDYSNKENPFHIVDITEYKSLTLLERLRITAHSYDTFNGGFTEDVMYTLLANYENNGKSIISYSEMRTI